MLVTVNNRLKFEIEIVHDLSCRPIEFCLFTVSGVFYACLAVLCDNKAASCHVGDKPTPHDIIVTQWQQ